MKHVGEGDLRLPLRVQVLAPYARDININERIMALYLEHILPGISAPGQDNNFGSSAMYDVLALQVGGLARDGGCWPVLFYVPAVKLV